MRQTKGKIIDEVNASGNNFLKSLLQIEDQDLSQKDKEFAEELITNILIHSELTLEHIKN